MAKHPLTRLNMARKKIPVGKTPICDPAYLRRIDPIWIPGPVPCRFWEDVEHRRDYLLWAGRIMRFKWMQDYYKLNFDSIRKKYNGGPIGRYWGSSQVKAVKDCFPDYDWKEWLFIKIPPHFWNSKANCRRYLIWLAEHLGFQTIEDWYSVSLDDFIRTGGRLLLVKYGFHSSFILADILPKNDWLEWKFTSVPEGFWDCAKNRHRYLRWLGHELGFRKPEDWLQIGCKDFISHHGSRLIKKSSSLYDLMREFMPKLDWSLVDRRRKITEKEILKWADAYHAKHGKWPNALSGRIPGTNYNWQAINVCLLGGHHGLPGGSSLPRLLTKYRGVRPWLGRVLSVRQILAWADAYHAKYGKWPTGTTPGSPDPSVDDSWKAIEAVLRSGDRGLPGGSSIARLLTEYRGVRPLFGRSLTEKQILAWVDAYYAEHGKWPFRNSPDFPDPSVDDSWKTIDRALRRGLRGLPGGSSLSRLLVKKRAVRPRLGRLLTEKQILAWADAYFSKHGKWPVQQSPDSPDPSMVDSWKAVDLSLRKGFRGLPGGSSIHGLLTKHRGVRPHLGRLLTEKQILAWADAYHAKHGKWPTGTTPGSPAPFVDDSWQAIDSALWKGFRGLPGGSSLAKLLKKYGRK